MKPHETTAAPPGKGWQPVAFARFNADGLTYNRGCLVPAEIVSQAKWRNGDVRWMPPGTVTGSPVPMAKPEPPRPNPTLALIDRGDDEASALATLADAIRKYGNPQLARDKIAANPELLALCLRGEKLRQNRARQRGRLPSLGSDYVSIWHAAEALV